MTMFDVQSIGIDAPAASLFAFLANPANLPKWTNAFRQADNESAQMAGPEGIIDIRLCILAKADVGTIDWTMTFPDGHAAKAFSRVVPDGDHRSIYTFVLLAPPMALEALEGAFEQQRKILTAELARLKALIETL